MTYGLGLFLEDGFVVTADTRSNAGVDHIATISKISAFQNADERVMVLASAGNLATTQAVVTILNQRLGQGGNPTNLFDAATMFDATKMVGSVLREVMSANAQHVQAYGDPSASFLFAGQIAGGPHRLFLIYPAGNFIEASPDTPYLQIGEVKYGKPILDRAMQFRTSLSEAVKLTLLSFDATVRSNLSVAPPFDMVIYRAGSLGPIQVRRVEMEDPYFVNIRNSYSDAIRQAVRDLAPADWPEIA
ncbi:peptidase [Minwuia thermotolerans]|uniref:Peptidase n=1 Tax=Minwuia thermotolerans TaxID=2056226 RepID=A0A2M9FWW1_9PROT|nr:peptidase [Minwuia thermotolerans]PJK27947.1 peptidase [Minwuia thermotolerans]